MFHHASSSSNAAEVEVERRVFAKTFAEVKSFLKVIRDIPEKSWQEERDAFWEMAIRRWVAVLDGWTLDGILLVQALQSKESFKEKAQILVDVFFNKAPQTLMKRVNSISKVCGQLASKGIDFPCSTSFLGCLARSWGRDRMFSYNAGSFTDFCTVVRPQNYRRRSIPAVYAQST